MFPDYFFLHQEVTKFYHDYKSHNIELIFYFDCSIDDHLKLNTKLDRLKQRISNLLILQSTLFDTTASQNELPEVDCPLWRLQCVESLRHAGARIINCIDEADFQLAKDGPRAFAILSNDSDFSIMQDSKWLPFHSVRFVTDPLTNQREIIGTLFSPEIVSELLAIPRSSLADFATLAGNDYSKHHILEKKGTELVWQIINMNLRKVNKYKRQTIEDTQRLPNINAVARAFQKEGVRIAYERLVIKSQNPLHEAAHFNRKFYRGEVLSSNKQVDNLLQVIEDQKMEGNIGLQLVQRVRDFRLPPSSFGIWLTGRTLNYVWHEAIEDEVDGGWPSTSQITRKLLSAICLLLGREKMEFGDRIGIDYSIIELDIKKEFPEFEALISENMKKENIRDENKNEENSERSCFVVTKQPRNICFSLLSCAMHPYASLLTGKCKTLLKLNPFLPLGLKTVVLICRYLIATLKSHNLPLDPNVLAAIISSTALLAEREFATSIMMLDKKKLLEEIKISFSDLPLVSISTYFQAILFRFSQLLDLLNLRSENPHYDVFATSPLLFSPQLFAYLYQKNVGFSEAKISKALEKIGLKITTPPNVLTKLCSNVQTSIRSVFLPHVFSNSVPPVSKSIKPRELIFNVKTAAPKKHIGITELPIENRLMEIIAQIRQKDMVIIQGATGCGKSSRVPLEIYKDYLNEKKKQHLRIVVTQPRRMAAVSLAKRVASQLGETVGQTVGYKVMGQDADSAKTKILFVTLGWLLAKITHNPQYFSTISHLVLDEIHERGLDSDILYVVVKKFLDQSSDVIRSSYRPKLILMSATCDAHLFASYFQPENPPEPIVIDQNPFPVDIYYLSEFLEHPYLHNKLPTSKIQLLAMEKNCQSTLLNSLDSFLKLLVRICIELAHAHTSTPDGSCILVFFSGIQDIEDALEEFYSLPQESQKLFQIVILHSEMEQEDCLSVFTPIPIGITRIILATNIAESSVTLPGVRYVIDFGTHKQVVHSPEYNCDTLQKN